MGLGTYKMVTPDFTGYRILIAQIINCALQVE
ncbi:MAG: hypothetical protein BMS9Abin21_130 [Thermodesulfovibrionia bacterium]|nr:MAG: hypothetical protein BMS9Abin21_130 [Thermodesulfovibrionia bacterium]